MLPSSPVRPRSSALAQGLLSPVASFALLLTLAGLANGCARTGKVASAPPPPPPGSTPVAASPIPGLPGIPGFPTLPGMPTLPTLPTIPGMPSLPSGFPGAPVAKPAPVDCHGPMLTSTAACFGDAAENEELKLHQLMNDLRARNGLPSILYSVSLSTVGNRHARDLDENVKSLTHSFSDCPYDEQNSGTFQCMWGAPQRVRTSFPGKGFELAFYISTGTALADDIIAAFEKDTYNQSVILNQGPWSAVRWNSLGIGIYGGYASVWFGQESDPAK